MAITRQQVRREARYTDKHDFSSRIIDLIKQNATDEDIKSELSRNNSRLPFHPLVAEDAFYHAAKNERYGIIPQLLERQDDFRWNALHLAVAYNDEKSILQHFSSTISELGCFGEPGDTPLHLAFRMANIKICKLLLENGCWEKYQGNDKDCIGHVAIEAIAWKCNHKTVWEWADFLLWLYTKGGMSLNSKTSKGHQTVEDLMSKWEIPTPIKTVIRYIKFGKNLGGLL